MPISTHLLRKLQETLGSEAAADLSHLLESMDADRGDIREFRHETQLHFAAVRADFKADMARLNQELRHQMATSSRELREEMTRSNRELREEMTTSSRELREEMTTSSRELREEMTKMRIEVLEAVRQVDLRVANTRADLLKWSFTFWVGAVLAIAALAGVLRFTS